MRRTVGAIFCTVTLLIAPAAQAEDPRARAHFVAGRQLATEERWAEAVKEFEASVTTEPSVGALLNLGQALEMVGRPSAARARFQEAELLAGPSDPRSGEAHARRDRLASHVGEVALLSAPQHTTIELDGATALALGHVIETDPGAHVIVATRSGQVQRITVEVIAGRRVDVVVPEVQRPVQTTDAPRIEERPSGPWRAIGWSSIAVGGAALAVGGVFALFAANDKAELEELCPAYPICPSSSAAGARAADGDLDRDAGVATVAVIAGAAFVVAGLAVLTFGPNVTPKRSALRSHDLALHF